MCDTNAGSETCDTRSVSETVDTNAVSETVVQCQTVTVKGSVFQVESLASNSELSTRSGGLQSWCGGGAASALSKITVVKDFSAHRRQ